jgi:hypothetical protein
MPQLKTVLLLLGLVGVVLILEDPEERGVVAEAYLMAEELVTMELAAEAAAEEVRHRR